MHTCKIKLNYISLFVSVLGGIPRLRLSLPRFGVSLKSVLISETDYHCIHDICRAVISTEGMHGMLFLV